MYFVLTASHVLGRHCMSYTVPMHGMYVFMNINFVGLGLSLPIASSPDLWTPTNVNYSGRSLSTRDKLFLVERLLLSPSPSPILELVKNTVGASLQVPSSPVPRACTVHMLLRAIRIVWEELDQSQLLQPCCILTSTGILSVVSPAQSNYILHTK